MSIRQARAVDHWRRTFLREYPIKYEEVEYENLFCLGSGHISFCGGITAIVGGNGVGKSTLAAAIGELLERDDLKLLLGNRGRLSGSALKGKIEENRQKKNRFVVEEGGGKRVVGGDFLESENRWLDPAYWAFYTREKITKDQNFEDLIEPLTAVKLSRDEVDLISYITGKEYEACEIFEIQDYAECERFPYFRAKAHGIEYGSEDMGQGELSLLLMFWILRDLHANSILIVEEPETHVSPKSQTALMNTIAKFCDEKGLWVIVTTHSPVIIQSLPTKNIRMLLRDGINVVVVEEVHRYQLAALLGGGYGARGVLLVEDEVAKELVIAMVDELDGDLIRQFDVVVAGSAGEITAALKSFPKTRSWFSLIGLYDGDQSGVDQGGQLHWPKLFLPGAESPEVMLRLVAQGDNGAELLAIELNKSRNAVVTAMDALAGQNPHDWLIGCVHQLSVSKAQLIRALTRIWLTNVERRSDGMRLVNDLKGAFNGGA